jgi:hypothetical protein
LSDTSSDRVSRIAATSTVLGPPPPAPPSVMGLTGKGEGGRWKESGIDAVCRIEAACRTSTRQHRGEGLGREGTSDSPWQHWNWTPTPHFAHLKARVRWPRGHAPPPLAAGAPDGPPQPPCACLLPSGGPLLSPGALAGSGSRTRGSACERPTLQVPRAGCEPPLTNR